MSTAAFNFEQVSGLNMSGSATVYEISAPNSPATLIRRDQSWKVAFNWQTSGPGGAFLAGTWKLAIYLEQMGPGEGPSLPLAYRYAEEAAVATTAPRFYTKEISIPALQVPAGLYKLCASITHVNTGSAPTPVAGFAEGSLLHFFEI